MPSTWQSSVESAQTWAASALPSGEAVQAVADSALGDLSMGGLLALAAAMGWASGVRLYLVVFLFGAFAYMGWLPFELPHGLRVLQHPAMLAASFALLFVEFFADKIPGLDSAWDVLNSVIRVPAGAALAAGVFGADDATMATVMALLGGTLAATSFSAKASTRLAVNTSPEPFSNVGVSLFEDGLVVFMLWLAVAHPIVFAFGMVLVLLVSVLLIWLLWRFLRKVLAKISAFIQRDSQQTGARM